MNLANIYRPFINSVAAPAVEYCSQSCDQHPGPRQVLMCRAVMGREDECLDFLPESLYDFSEALLSSG